MSFFVSQKDKSVDINQPSVPDSPARTTARFELHGAVSSTLNPLDGLENVALPNEDIGAALLPSQNINGPEYSGVTEENKILPGSSLTEDQFDEGSDGIVNLNIPSLSSSPDDIYDDRAYLERIKDILNKNNPPQTIRTTCSIFPPHTKQIHIWNMIIMII